MHEEKTIRVYHRASKKKNLIFFFVLAIAVHIVIFRVPVKEKVASGLCKAISVCIVSSDKPAVLPLPANQTVEPFSKTPVKPKLVIPSEPFVSATAPSSRKALTQPLQEKKTESVASPVTIPDYDNPEAYAEPTPVDEPVFSDYPPPDSRISQSDNSTGGSIETAAVGKSNALGDAGTEALSEKEGEGVITFAMPRYKDNPPPRYPRMAKRHGYEGRTVLEVEVFENGRVGKVFIAESSGFDVLDRAALKSVKKWIFVPGTENGQCVRQQVMVPVRFDLN